MTDAPGKEVFTLPFAQESYLNSSVITVIVSLKASRHACAALRLYITSLQVDDIHFRLDSYFLQRESETLKAMITNSKSDSIHLQNATLAQLTALWRFFYEG